MPSLFFSIIFVTCSCHKFTSFALTSPDLRVISLALAMPSGNAKWQCLCYKSGGLSQDVYKAR